MGKRRRRLSKVAALMAAAAVTFVAAESRAEQFVLFDATFTYTWDDAVNAKPSKSHYYVNEGNWLNKQRPVNWTSPVNYRDGKVHIHYEVLEKPAGTQQAGWALCYVANVGEYGCPYTDYYKSVGVYEKDVDMHTFYNNTTIQWDKGVKQVDLVYTVNGSGSGHITNFPELKDLVTPTKVRITMVQVSMGATYDPSIIAKTPPVEPGADASVPPPRDAATDAGGEASAPIVDAGATPEVGAPATGAAGVTGAAGEGAAGAGAAGEGMAGTSGGAGAGAAGATPPPTVGAAGSNGSTGGTGVSPGGHVASGGCHVTGDDAGGGGPPLAAGATAIVIAFARRRRRR
jgi:MYXO-CTERM domain-containing protein